MKSVDGVRVGGLYLFRTVERNELVLVTQLKDESVRTEKLKSVVCVYFLTRSGEINWWISHSSLVHTYFHPWPA